MFNAKPYSAHSWLAAWHYAPKLCWEDMLNEFEQDVEKALRHSNDVDATLAHIYSELYKVHMPTDPGMFALFCNQWPKEILLAKDGQLDPLVKTLKRDMDIKVSWLIKIARRQPTAA